MPSRTIRPTEAPAPAPFAYTIGAADGLAPEAVFAQWDGTGAGGDFLPCVSYYSAEGVLLDRAFPTTGPVGAGDVADVSYRPFDRGGAAKAGGGGPFETFGDGGGVSVASGGTDRLIWVHDSDAVLFALGGSPLGSVATLIAGGVYAFTMIANPLSIPVGNYTIGVQFLAKRGFGITAFVTAAAPRVVTSPLFTGALFSLTRSFAAGDTFTVDVTHNAAGNVTLGLFGIVQKVA